jgi:hypothetical protein
MAEPTIPIPSELRRPHRFVTATRQAASGRTPQEDGRIRVGGTGVVRLTVTREQLRRALLVTDAILKEAEKRGHSVEAVDRTGYGDKPGVAIVVRGHHYTIELTELQDRVPLTAEELAEWDRQEAKRQYDSWQKRPQRPTHRKVPNGYLRVSLPSGYDGSRNSFSEGPRGAIDRRLPTLFEELAARAGRDDERVRERERMQEERVRAAQERAEREQLQRVENARAARLTEEITGWRLARDARIYVEELRHGLDALEPDDRERIRAWCEWIEGWVARADPTTNPRRIHGVDDEHDSYFVR